MKTESYNGWKNFETWNVALWIGNDEGLYNMAREYRNKGFKAFVAALRDMDHEELDGTKQKICLETPDGVAWNDSGLDIQALDALLGEL